MQHTTTAPEGNLVRAALLRQAAALREQAVTLEALAELAKSSSPHDAKLIPLTPKALAPYYVAQSAAKRAARSGELPSMVGSRQRLLVAEADLLTWRDSRVASCGRLTPTQSQSTDPLEAALASGQLRKATRG